MFLILVFTYENKGFLAVLHGCCGSAAMRLHAGPGWQSSLSLGLFWLNGRGKGGVGKRTLVFKASVQKNASYFQSWVLGQGKPLAPTSMSGKAEMCNMWPTWTVITGRQRLCMFQKLAKISQWEIQRAELSVLTQRDQIWQKNEMTISAVMAAGLYSQLIQGLWPPREQGKVGVSPHLSAMAEEWP